MTSSIAAVSGRGQPEPGMTHSASRPRSPAFLLAFALANAGGVLAYLPFLSLCCLPLKVEAMAGETRVTVLSFSSGGRGDCGRGGQYSGRAGRLIAVFYAVSPAGGSVTGRGGLRAWIAAGMVATALSFALILVAHTPAALFLAVIAFELALNVLIAPVAMVLVDRSARCAERPGPAGC